jgi:hypothetical protein
MTLKENGRFYIGRDQTGTISVGGSLVLASGGQLRVGRNLAGLSVKGDVRVNSTGGILVGDNLDSKTDGVPAMTVGGIFRGQNDPTHVDLAVGLNLNGLLVQGGGANQGGIQQANINVGKDHTKLNVPHGIFRSWITAGVSMSGVSVGADGVTAIYDSEIDAGTSITNLTVGGDVVSDFPTNPKATGYPTRIIAGKVRGAETGSTPDQGVYLPNGSISGLVINGALIDAVLAASVAPFGGDGSLPPPLMYGVQPQSAGTPPGVFTNYQAPAGKTGTTPNYSIRDVNPGSLTAAWAQPEQPVGSRHATVLNNGSITAKVTGGVITTQTDPRLDDTYDYAGFFAVNTIGVASS